MLSPKPGKLMPGTDSSFHSMLHNPAFPQSLPQSRHLRSHALAATSNRSHEGNVHALQQRSEGVFREGHGFDGVEIG
jgi:hypothetical protein